MPEIDDGSRTTEEAVEMAQIAADDGIEQMVSTPHMFNGLSNNPSPAEITARVQRLQEAVGDIIRILPGNEVHISHEIAEQVRDNRVTRINNKNYILVEFPQLTVPIGADELFYKIQLQSVFPILVHPERNVQIQNKPAIVQGFVERGVLIQVTAMSVTGEFGAAPKQTAERLLRHNCVHFLATDAHRTQRRPPILSRGRDAAAKIVGEERAHRLVYENPLAVVNGEIVPIESPIPFTQPGLGEKRGFLKRFFG